MQDKALYDRIYSQYYPLMKRIAIKSTNDPHIAEDVLQETFLKAWANLHSLEKEESARAWLTTILFNENARRFRRKQLELVDIEEPGNMPTNNELERLGTPWLAEQIDRLDTNYRNAITLKVLYGYSTQETATILGINAKTVGTRVHRAKSLIKQNLTPTPEGETCQ
ncbi:sigma-70 family RNA polymerase sigma factor [Vibrio parahaemolyticus]|nr:sigma-70 family RNA polymerase sigma factor [Vibrio parahaemolyticus]